jgi:spermidine synthase
MMDRSAFRGLLICLALSGISGLIYEVAWVRSLELIFGATSFAVATVLASFMGGLAAGSFLAGRLAPRLERHHPLRVYAAFEILIAAVALVIPLSFRALVPLYQTVAGSIHASFAIVSLIRFLLCAAVLTIPTALMGATLPVVSRFAARHEGQEAARRVGVLYAVNTMGAVCGCAAAGFFLLPTLGLLGTQWFAVALNLMSAAGAAWIAARAPLEAAGEGTCAPQGGAPRAATLQAAAPREASLQVPPPRGAALLIGFYAVSGGVSMLYEVAWSRYLVLVLGSSTYSYTVMLTTFLIGLTIGAALGARLLRQSPDPIISVALCQLLVAVTVFLGLFTAGELPYLYHLLHDRLHPTAGMLLGIQLVMAGGVMILPTIGLGAMFPLTLGGLGLTGAGAQRLVARAYAWNTTGAIVGSILSGFWLVPAIGSRDVLLAGIAINALLALIGLAALRPGVVPRAQQLLLALLVVLFLGNLFVSTPTWRADVMSSGIFRYADRYRGLDRAAFLDLLRRSHGDVLFFDEGLTCTVTVFRTTQSLTLMVNGKPDASVPPDLADPAPSGRAIPQGDLPTQVLVGELPLLLAHRRDDVLVVGLGSGVTLGSILRHPVRRVDCLELEPAVVAGSRFFDAQSGAPIDDPRVHLVVNDARNDLLVRDATYDVIVSEPSNPWIPGAASLFTRDFFEIAARRLRPDGLFCQWIQLYELWPQDVQTMLRSFMAVFPAVQMYRVGFDAILIGANSEIKVPVRQLLERGTAQVRADLHRVGVDSPEELLAHFWIGGDELRRAVPPGPLNTDDNMRIEFAAPLRMLSRDPDRLERQKRELGAMFAGHATGVVPGLVFPDGGAAGGAGGGAAGDAVASGFLTRMGRAALQLGFADEAAHAAEQALLVRRNPEAAGVRAEALAAAGHAGEAARARDDAEREFPRDKPLRSALLEMSGRAGDKAALRRNAEAILAIDPGDPLSRAALAAVLAGEGDTGGALRLMEPLMPMFGEASAGAGLETTDEHDLPSGAGRLFGRLLCQAGRCREAVVPLRAHLGRHPDDPEALSLLAKALRAAGDEAGATALDRRLSPHAADEAAARLAEAAAAYQAGRFAAARETLLVARDYAPDHEAIALLLARALRRLDDRPAAIASLEALLAAHPERAWALGYLGQLLGESGRADQAGAVALRYRALTGDDWTRIPD